MLETSTKVEIPADVRDNSPHTVRVLSTGLECDEIAGATTAHDLTYYRDRYRSLGWSMHVSEVVVNGLRTVTTRFYSRELRKVVHTYRTRYYTRVKCAECKYRWSQYYMTVTTEDGTSEAVPRCGTHTDLFLKSTRGIPGVTVNLSEPLCIGQHD